MSFDEIKENDYNLNIPRYIDTFEEEPDELVGTCDANAMLQAMRGNLKKLW